MSDSSNSTAAAAAAAAAAATAAFPHIPVGDTLGAWLIGVCISYLLQGMLFHQAFKYYMTFHKDRWVLKAWVAVVLVLETLATVLITHTAYFYMVTKYWEPTYFFVSPTVWSLNVLPPPAALAAFISQSFFARRLWLIAPKFRILVAVAMVLIAGNVACFSVLAATMFRSATLSEWLQYSWLATLGSSIQVTGDLSISAALVYTLHTSRTGISVSPKRL
ncbi:uncharacterized protein BXZ73DRAFT_105044 [Epithele typhae]|uniref:uncharacterized protein n=1 Tax=Epithele typhae TaxID=378194 RepID=UPI002007B324|nr:uncharacterized protein BXZ73DRAFT_105044 [Epithele typhae]KAH9918888.1 hypothetical protein BXZ73DRAFT_105044 [Epithele typhae]